MNRYPANRRTGMFELMVRRSDITFNTYEEESVDLYMVKWEQAVHKSNTSILPKTFGRLITFFAVIVAWVMFRAESLDGAINMYAGMFGGNGVSLPTSLEPILISLSEPLSIVEINYDGMFKNDVFGSPKHGIFMLFVMLLIVWFAPNTYDLLKNEKPVLGLEDYLLENKSFRLAIWKYNAAFAFVLALITVACVISMSSPSEFLYFQF